MSHKYANLVEQASRSRDLMLKKAFNASASRGTVDECAIELDIVNRHITVAAEEVNGAAAEYTTLGQCLVDTLPWGQSEIAIMPQGSTSTQTLVRAPTVEKFDIDAVCLVDIDKVEAYDPMAFFDKVGKALEHLRAEEKNRCWRIHYPNRGFYIDFTPSVPLSSVPFSVRHGLRNPSMYAETALAVVDRPTGTWKTSNPQGIVKWVSTQAQRRILRKLLLRSEAMDSATITPVPEQDVPLSDTLRVAIRLFKRHRDMAAKRNQISAEFKPISVIITTTLTQCYEGLADAGASYHHPVELLADLAEMLPHMVEQRDGKHWVANPTVDGENFAERWNSDNNQRFSEFRKWCGLLKEDLADILNCNSAQLRETVQRTFGCLGTEQEARVMKPSWLAGAAPTVVRNVPPTRGLA